MQKDIFFFCANGSDDDDDGVMCVVERFQSPSNWLTEKYFSKDM